MTDPCQVQRSLNSLLVPPKFSYVINCSPKPPTCSPIPLPWDKNHCSLVVMSEGGVSYLFTVAKLMQNWGYVYSILLNFSDNSNECCLCLPFFASISTISLPVIFVWAFALWREVGWVRDCNISIICVENSFIRIFLVKFEWTSKNVNLEVLCMHWE
jgi:hypothetical protein